MPEIVTCAKIRSPKHLSHSHRRGAFYFVLKHNAQGSVRAEHMESNFVLPVTYMKGLSSSSCSAGLKIWAVADTVPVNSRDVRSPRPICRSRCTPYQISQPSCLQWLISSCYQAGSETKEAVVRPPCCYSIFSKTITSYGCRIWTKV